MHYIPLLYLALFAMIAFSMPAQAGQNFFDSIYNPDNPCRDWVDNDADGLIDWVDPSCNKIGTPNRWHWVWDVETQQQVKRYLDKEQTQCTDGHNNDYNWNAHNPPGTPSWDGVDHDGGWVGSLCHLWTPWATQQEALDDGLIDFPCVIDQNEDGHVSWEEQRQRPWQHCNCWAPADPQCVSSRRDTETPVNGNCGIGFELAFLLPPLMWLRRRAVKGGPGATGPDQTSVSGLSRTTSDPTEETP